MPLMAKPDRVHISDKFKMKNENYFGINIQLLIIKFYLKILRRILVPSEHRHHLAILKTTSICRFLNGSPPLNGRTR